ncbi:hypothetical protein [Pseudomonas moraviensis]|uniref:Uncharacterized protein n=1 Tax=Pseudomonas moraviensis TaxID=321662 RepID=A0A7Z0AUG3_9PSED|nr:hypothetical protein [Pseudomonas moraviensis]NYH10251.1 hypothetical protein [Pseudomonas moraviensis]
MEEYEDGTGENGKQESDQLPTSRSLKESASGIQETVIIVATNSNYPSTRADMEIVALWDNNGRAVSFSTRRYWASHNGQNKGNLSLHGQGVTDWNPQWDDVGQQQGRWISFEHSGRVQVNNDNVPMSWYWRYDRASDGDITLLGYHTFHYRPAPLFISSPPSVVPNRTFTIRGLNAAEVSAVIVVKEPLVGGLTFSGRVVNAAGEWEAEVTIPQGRNSISVYALQIVRNSLVSDPSDIVTVSLAQAATIIQPPEGATVRIENIVFTGTTYSTANIVVVRNDNHWVALSESKQETTSNWTRSLLPTIMLPSDELKVEAQQTYGGITYSQVRTFIVESYPIIQTPAASTEQATTFTVTGTGGRPGATLYIQKDQDPSTVYGTTTATASNWSVQATLPPGRHTVTPEQVMGGVRSKPGVPRTYIILPPKITGLAAAVDADSNLTLSGLGYKGAEVVIYLTTVNEPIATTTVAVSIWSVVIKNWLPGSYIFKFKQRVPDVGGGWIESAEERLTFVVPVPLPRLNVDVSPEGIPRFYGTANYWPNHPAQVEVRIHYTTVPIVPIVPVAGSGTWSSTAQQPWKPDTYQVVAQLGVAGQLSLWTSAITVIIPDRRPPPPTIDPVEDNGLSPWFRGTCAGGATVTLTFTHPPTTPVNATVSGPTWSHQRALPFTAGVVHGVSATQTIGGDTSLPVSTTFTLTAPTPQPAITYPPPREETDSDLTVTGDNGKAGASMQLWDARDKKPLGHPVILTHNGVWSISLYALVIDSWFISAQQTHNNRPSEHSDIREFFVVVMPPEFLNPLPGSDLPRTSTLSGKGRPNGRVTVWCKGGTEPLLRDVLIGPDGVWEGSVTRAVGAEVLWATQTFEGKTSKPSVDVPCRFVPHAVVPESPLPEELLGKTVTVSGFAVPDDKITLKRGTTVLGETLVLPDRTWSITSELAPPDGAVTLSVVASNGEFHSAPSEWVGQLGLYLPEFTKPAAGQWGLPAMTFAGLGKPGLGTLMSWYNPDVVLAESVPVTSDGWAATSTGPLAEGVHWCRFWQTLSTGTPNSDCAESGRFDVRNESPGDS